MTPDELLKQAREIRAEHERLIAVTQADGPGSAGGYLSLSQFEETEGRRLLDMLPDLIVLVERQQDALVEERASHLFQVQQLGSWEACKIEARRQLSIQKRPRFTAEEQEAIGSAILALRGGIVRPNMEKASILRRMLEEE